MWTLNWILYEPIWKRSLFHFRGNIIEPLRLNSRPRLIPVASTGVLGTALAMWTYEIGLNRRLSHYSGLSRERENMEFGCSFFSRQGKHRKWSKTKKNVLHREFICNGRKICVKNKGVYPGLWRDAAIKFFPGSKFSVWGHPSMEWHYSTMAPLLQFRGISCSMSTFGRASLGKFLSYILS